MTYVEFICGSYYWRTGLIVYSIILSVDFSRPGTFLGIIEPSCMGIRIASSGVFFYSVYFPGYRSSEAYCSSMNPKDYCRIFSSRSPTISVSMHSREISVPTKECNVMMIISAQKTGSLSCSPSIRWHRRPENDKDRGRIDPLPWNECKSRLSPKSLFPPKHSSTIRVPDSGFHQSSCLHTWLHITQMNLGNSTSFRFDPFLRSLSMDIANISINSTGDISMLWIPSQQYMPWGQQVWISGILSTLGKNRFHRFLRPWLYLPPAKRLSLWTIPQGAWHACIWLLFISRSTRYARWMEELTWFQGWLMKMNFRDASKMNFRDGTMRVLWRLGELIVDCWDLRVGNVALVSACNERTWGWFGWNWKGIWNIMVSKTSYVCWFEDMAEKYVFTLMQKFFIA